MERLISADPNVVLYAARVIVWGRWFIVLVNVFLIAYRPSFWYPDDIEHLYLHVPLVLSNGLIHYRLLTNRSVTWRWMLALCALDIALISAHAIVRGGYDNITYLAYYPALGAFAVVFSSFRLVVAWTTATAIVYTLVCVLGEAGLDRDTGQEKILVARLAVMYLIAVGISLIVRFERMWRQVAMQMERQAQRERTELSQSIHDTSAQTAYMIGLGIDGAMELAGDSNPKLTERLAATAALSRSAMWELRRPIDMGLLFEGRELGRVLGSHTATFAKIASIPAEMRQSGYEPPLSNEVRTGLFSIAHNALTNAFLHAEAGMVEVRLDFEEDHVRLSISDDGVGLPEDYAELGRGFRGMETDAGRMNGELTVESGGPEMGTRITCVVPITSVDRED